MMRTDVGLPDDIDPDVLGDIGADLSGPPVGDGPTPPSDVPDGQAVCQHVEDDGSVCGYTGTPNQVHMHSIGKHRDRTADAAPGKAKRATKKAAPKRRGKPAEQSAAQQAAYVGNRATVYTSSLALAGLAAHLAIPAFDQYDLDVWNKGVPGIGASLDQLGEQNQTVRQTCDLILGGGSGGAYLNLILSVSAIAMPILAHHGVLPPSVGERFGMMIGAAAPEPSPHSRPEARESSPDSERVGVYPTPETPEDVLQYLGDVPPRIGADLNRMMMGGAGATVVAVPDTAAQSPHVQPGPGDDTDGERGSEQLNPERREPVAVP